MGPSPEAVTFLFLSPSGGWGPTPLRSVPPPRLLQLCSGHQKQRPGGILRERCHDLEDCVIFLFLQWLLILGQVFTTQGSPNTCSLSSSSDCSSRGLGKTPNTRTKIGKLFFDLLKIK